MVQAVAAEPALIHAGYGGRARVDTAGGQALAEMPEVANVFVMPPVMVKREAEKSDSQPD